MPIKTKYTRKSRLSRSTKHSKLSCKIRNSLTRRAQLNKLQDGGSEHYSSLNKGINKRVAERAVKLWKAFLAKSKHKKNVPLSDHTFTLTSQQQSNLSLAIARAKLLKSLMRGK